jgi:zinc/manganese transport system substrate-binding protein
MKTLLCALALLFCVNTPAQAEDSKPKLVVVTTLRYLADVARAVGGDEVSVHALAPINQDPHFIQPTPARSLVLSKADVFLESGVQLEAWSERVIDGARNAKIRRGAPGHVFCAQGIKPLQVPSQQTRASGEVHAGGNPHVWLDPLNLKRIAKNIQACLAKVRPEARDHFAKNLKAFSAKIDLAFYGPELIRLLGARRLNLLQKRGRLRAFLAKQTYKGKALAERAGGWLKRAMALQGLKVFSWHQVWTYFESAFGIEVVSTIEEKPGIPPSPRHLTQLVATAKARGVRVVVSASFYPASRAAGVAERIGGQSTVLPTQPGEAKTKDVFALFDEIFTRLEAAAAK